ncbi:MAG: DUF885 domain-containing protein [Pseudomonadota bacterium]
MPTRQPRYQCPQLSPASVFATAFALVFDFLSGASPAVALTADAGYMGTPYRSDACESDLSYLNQVRGWQLSWTSAWESINQQNAEEVTAALIQWREAPQAVEAAIRYLSTEKPQSQKAPTQVASRVLNQVQQLADLLADSDSKLFDRSTQDKRWSAFLSDEVRPSVQAFAEYLALHYLPDTKSNPALSKSPRAIDCFEAAVLWWTGLELKIENIRSIGERLLQESEADLAKTLEPGQSYAALMSQLRELGSKSSVSRDELQTLSEAALTRAGGNAQIAFAEPINKGVVVEAMPSYMEEDFPAGFYRRGSPEAAYVINLSRPASRRLMAEVIAFHEGIPGHHLQFTYPTDGSSTGFNSGFGEGWAIYAEYLADELGLYSSQLDRQGMMAKHLWAASRLVIEPNIQSGRWSREQAISYMQKTTTLPRKEIEIEIDRYYAIPGQSLSYMLGYDTIAQLRKQAEKTLQSKFELKEFHHAVLRRGMQPLPKLRENIESWLALSEADFNAR